MCLLKHTQCILSEPLELHISQKQDYHELHKTSMQSDTSFTPGQIIKYLYFRGMITVIFQMVTQKIMEGIIFELNISNTIKKCQLPMSFSYWLEIEVLSEKEVIWCFPDCYFIADNATSCIKSNKQIPMLFYGGHEKNQTITVAMDKVLNDCAGGFIKTSNILNKGLIVYLLLYHINWFLITLANSPLPNSIQKWIIC